MGAACSSLEDVSCSTMTELGLVLAFPPLMMVEVEEFLLSNGGRACSDIVGGCDMYVVLGSA